jgi:hypothetical protein
MLNFYLLDDSQPRSKQPGQNLVHLGGIEAQTFYQMQAEGVIEAQLDYYADFRWSNEVVARMRLLLHSKQKSIAFELGVSTFASILQEAVNVKSGVIAFGD